MSELSTDILESQFGPTEVEVLMQHGRERVISTKSADNGRVLELSRVIFKAEAAADFPLVYREIAEGKSMGKAFRDLGVPFKRRTRAVYRCDPGPVLRARFGLNGKVTIVDLTVLAGSEERPYADILEVYSPSVSWPQEGGPPGPELHARISDFTRLLTNLDD